MHTSFVRHFLQYLVANVALGTPQIREHHFNEASQPACNGEVVETDNEEE